MPSISYRQCRAAEMFYQCFLSTFSSQSASDDLNGLHFNPSSLCSIYCGLFKAVYLFVLSPMVPLDNDRLQPIVMWLEFRQRAPPGCFKNCQLDSNVTWSSEEEANPLILCSIYTHS